MIALLVCLTLGADAYGFSGGVAPLRGASSDPKWAACEKCHARVALEHAGSQHAQASTHPLYAQAYRLEPSALCRNCHDPLGGDAGITCAVCHVREGVVLGARAAPRAPHPVRVDPGLKSELCAGCHEFPFAVPRGKGFVLVDAPMQSTFSEWRKVDARPDAACTTCHLKAGHAFPGGHDPALVRRSLEVQLAGGELLLSTIGVGHRFPTGDVFRRLMVEVSEPGGRWRRVGSLGRRFEGVNLVEDTSLEPGAVRRLALGEVTPLSRLRLRYLYAPPTHFLEQSVPVADLSSIILEEDLAKLSGAP